jgi:hypothetical protein
MLGERVMRRRRSVAPVRVPDSLPSIPSPVDGAIEAVERITPRWAAPLFAGMALVLVPWIGYLVVSLPPHVSFRHYNVSWVGFDLLLLAALARTAWLAYRHSRRVALPAVVTATLLVVDAWFDVTSAHRGGPFVEALLLAVLVELPLAGVCLYLARHVERESGKG